jgi:hypothetical protein
VPGCWLGYSLSYSTRLFTSRPWTSLPLNVAVLVLPSAESLDLTVILTWPPFLIVDIANAKRAYDTAICYAKKLSLTAEVQGSPRPRWPVHRGAIAHNRFVTASGQPFFQQGASSEKTITTEQNPYRTSLRP